MLSRDRMAPIGPFSDLKLNSHEALMMRQQSSSILQSIESRQRQCYRELLINRDEELYLDKKTIAYVKSLGSDTVPQAMTPCILPRSELEVVSE